MTQERWWELLAERAKKHKWILTKNRMIREEDTGCCPLVAVAEEAGWNRREITVAYFMVPEEFLPSRPDRSNTVQAADSLVFQDQELRNRLLTTLGIQS